MQVNLNSLLAFSVRLGLTTGYLAALGLRVGVSLTPNGQGLQFQRHPGA